MSKKRKETGLDFEIDMKKKSIELDVDFIGGQGPLTKEEEVAISEFIRKDKENGVLKTNEVKQSKKLNKISNHS